MRNERTPGKRFNIRGRRKSVYIQNEIKYNQINLDIYVLSEIGLPERVRLFCLLHGVKIHLTLNNFSDYDTVHLTYVRL